jgi:hypothetical protein
MKPRTLAQWAFLFLVRPVFPFLQWLGRASGLFVRAKTVEGPYLRQPYVIGFLKDDATIEMLTTHLAQHGFAPERIAYPDPGQTLSLRKLDDMHPIYQYHLRAFEGGELRGHYEFTPEDRPLAHMNETVFEERNDEFRAWIGSLLR